MRCEWVNGFLTVHFKVVEDTYPPENHAAKPNFGPESAMNPVNVWGSVRTGHGKRESDI